MFFVYTFLALGLLFLMPAVLWSPSMAQEDQGAAVFSQCSACHQIGMGAKNLVGPPLTNIVGSPIAAQEYSYSLALQSLATQHGVWSEDLLDTFLQNPLSLSSGTTMTFAGVVDAGKRKAIIAYLKDFGRQGTPMEDSHRDPELPQTLLEQQGDIAYGEYLASECTTCHQADGTDKGIPSITGWPREAFLSAMHAYREKVRDNVVMQQIAGALGQEELASLADYFAQQ